MRSISRKLQHHLFNFLFYGNSSGFIEITGSDNKVSSTLKNQSRKTGNLPGIVVAIRIEYHHNGASGFNSMTETEENCIRFSCSMLDRDYFSTG